MKNSKGWFSKLFKGSGTAIFTMFIWELLEEGLENLIAFTISSVTAIFITKAITTLGIVVATQGLKTVIKRFLFPIILSYTYKEGNDKMSKVMTGLKNYWTLAWNNKVTGTFAGVGFGVVSYFQTFCAFATGNLWFALIVFVVFYNIAICFGGETLGQIIDRIAEKTKNKELKAQLKKVQQAQAFVNKHAESEQLLAEAKKIIAEAETKN